MRRSQARRFRTPAAALLLLLGGCDAQDTGYVQVQLGRTGIFGAPELYLDGFKLDFARSSTVVMRFRTGSVALKTSDSVWSPAICRIVVRKNRISVVTVATNANPPRCLCQIPAAESTPSGTVCA